MDYCPTELLLADFFTKPLQGKQFRIFRNAILNIQEPLSNLNGEAIAKESKPSKQHPNKVVVSQECVRQNGIKNVSRDLSNSTHVKRTYCDVCKKGKTK